MPRPPAGRTRLTVESLEGRETPTAGPWAVETFDSAQTGATAPGWAAWASDPAPGFRVAAGGAAGNGVTSVGDSRRADRTWLSEAIPADEMITAALRVDSLIPAQVFVRGRNLDGTRPTYYAASIVRGPEVRLVRVAGGTETELARLTADGYLSGAWLDVTLTAQGNRLQVRVRRRDTGPG